MNVISRPFGIFEVWSRVRSMNILSAMKHVLIRNRSWADWLRRPHYWVNHRCLLCQTFLVNNWSCGILLWCDRIITPKFCIVILECYILAKTMLIEFFGSEAFGMMKMIVLDWWAILSDEFTNRVIRLDAPTYKVIVNYWRNLLSIIQVRSDQLVISRDFGHVFLIKYLLCENLLHDSIAVVHLGYCRQHLICIWARVDLWDLSTEKYST